MRSVTKILNLTKTRGVFRSSSGVSAKKALWRGEYIHRLISLYLLKEIQGNEPVLPEEMIQYWQNILPVLNQVKKVIAVESPFEYRENLAGYGQVYFSGILDGIVIFNEENEGNEELVLVEWKTSAGEISSQEALEYSLQATACLYGANKYWNLKLKKAIIFIISTKYVKHITIKEPELEILFDLFLQRANLLQA